MLSVFDFVNKCNLALVTNKHLPFDAMGGIANKCPYQKIFKDWFLDLGFLLNFSVDQHGYIENVCLDRTDSTYFNNLLEPLSIVNFLNLQLQKKFDLARAMCLDKPTMRSLSSLLCPFKSDIATVHETHCNKNPRLLSVVVVTSNDIVSSDNYTLEK